MRIGLSVAPRATRRLLLLCLLAMLPIGAATARQFVPAGTSPATGHAQVVTQGISTLPGEPVVWRVVERTAQPRWEAKAGDRVLGFILASDEPILLSNLTVDGTTKDVARLGVGEAFLVDGGTKQIRASLGDHAVTYLSLELVPASAANKVGNGRVLYQSDPFSPPAGERDLDLVRNVLKRKETATLPDTGQPNYILATDGAIDIQPAGGKRFTLQSGESAIVTGALTITATEPAAEGADRIASTALTADLLQATDGGAGYVVATIGEEIGPVQTPTPIPSATTPPLPTEAPLPTDTETPSEDPTDVPTDAPTVTDAPTEVPTEIPTEVPTATDVPRIDSDEDGILDGDEAQYGTDPHNADTDQDGLTDGDELFTYGTDPLDADTDGDNRTDGYEVLELHSDPLDPNDPPR